MSGQAVGGGAGLRSTDPRRETKAAMAYRWGSPCVYNPQKTAQQSGVWGTAPEPGNGARMPN